MIRRTVVRIKQAAVAGFLMLMAAAAAAAPWPVQDLKLQACLDEIAKQHGWSAPGDFQSIQCHNRDIESLDGVDAFAHITSLSLYNNRLQRVQLRNFPRLQLLNVARNDLRELELGQLPALGKLYFFDNHILALKLSDLPVLEELKGNNNGMKTFGYSALPRLKKIYLFNNLMETIDIHQLPALQYMDVRQNPMPDELYEKMDAMGGITFLHDGNAEDW
jgi:protein phosphatase 1 regulatory subunit 7